MADANPSGTELKRLLTDATVIAMVGASSNPDKASHGIMQKLRCGSAGGNRRRDRGDGRLHRRDAQPPAGRYESLAIAPSSWVTSLSS